MVGPTSLFIAAPLSLNASLAAPANQSAEQLWQQLRTLGRSVNKAALGQLSALPSRDEVAATFITTVDQLNVKMTDVVTPSIPSVLISTSVTSLTVLLAWSASSDAIAVAAYDVFRSRNGTTNCLSSVTVPFLAFTDPHILSGTTCTDTAKARDSAGNSSLANTAFAVTTAALANSDNDAVHDTVEVALGTQANPSAPTPAALQLKIHSPQP